MKKLIGIIFVVSSLSVQANLLVNGDFEAGNTGFSTEYLWQADVGADGKYVIATSVPNGWAPGFVDHTSGIGNMMVVNASVNTAATFWSQAISVVDGVEYTFSGFAADLTVAPTPNIQLKVNGIDVGNHFSVVDTPSAEWQEFSFTWTASGTSATLSLYDLTGTVGGDDFALDDLSVIPEPATMGLMALFGGGTFFVRRIFMI